MNRVEARQPGSSRLAGAWVLLDFDRQLASVEDEGGLEAALRALPETASVPNAIATLVSPRGDLLAVGIAGQGDRDNPGLDHPVASVEYNRASGDPPYLVPVEDPAAPAGDAVAVFRFAGQWTEIPLRNCVPIEVMVRIAREFFATGRLPDWIAWEEV